MIFALFQGMWVGDRNADTLPSYVIDVKLSINTSARVAVGTTIMDYVLSRKWKHRMMMQSLLRYAVNLIIMGKPLI